MKEAVLGKDYQLSLVFVGDRLSRKFNRMYRQHDTPATVLSFPLSKDDGEILINLAKAKRVAHTHNMGYRQFVGYLFIHGLLHLKGLKHGSTMEQQERTVLAQFAISS